MTTSGRLLPVVKGGEVVGRLKLKTEDTSIVSMTDHLFKGLLGKRNIEGFGDHFAQDRFGA